MDLRQLVEHLSSVRDNVSVRDNINVYETLKNQVLGGFKISYKIINEKEKIYYKHEFIRIVGAGIRFKKITIL